MAPTRVMLVIEGANIGPDNAPLPFLRERLGGIVPQGGFTALEGMPEGAEASVQVYAGAAALEGVLDAVLDVGWVDPDAVSVYAATPRDNRVGQLGVVSTLREDREFHRQFPG